MDQKPVLVVMAAGMGSRYGGLKQVDPVGPNSALIIDYSIYDARRAGFETVVFVIKKELEETFRTSIGDRLSKVMKVRYVYQELTDLPEGYAVPQGLVKPLGTCHAVLAARKVVDGPFAVINSDDYYGPEAFREVYQYLCDHPDQEGCYSFAMVGYLLGNTVTEHTHIEKDGDNARYTEDDGQTWGTLPGDAIVSMNLWGFSRSFLTEAEARFPAFLDKTLKENPEKGEYYLPSVVSALIEEGKAKVKVLRSHDRWYGVTYREDKPTVVAAIARMTEEGLYPADLWS